VDVGVGAGVAVGAGVGVAVGAGVGVLKSIPPAAVISIISASIAL